jgi:hypothetical protein
MVKPRILIYPRRMALRRVVLEGEPRAREPRDTSGERGVFEIGDGRGCGVDREGSDEWERGRGNVRGIRGVKRRGRWDVESPHIFAGSFRTNENGYWVSRGKNG